jgi:hypothetical protein
VQAQAQAQAQAQTNSSVLDLLQWLFPFFV